MKHKTKGFIAMILALCLMMSLGIGALADGGSEGDNSVPTLPGDVNLPDVGDPGGGGDSTEPDDGYPITCMTVEGNGEVTASVSEAAEGTEVTLTVTPDEGYRLEHLNILKNGSAYADIDNDDLEDGKYTFEMPASVVIITAIFEQVYKITVNPSDNGSVTASVTASGPASVTEATEGDHITLTVTPNSGYVLDNLTVTGGSGAVPVTANTFNMPESDVTVTATFKEKEDDPETPGGDGSGDTDPGDSGYQIKTSATNGTVTVLSALDMGDPPSMVTNPTKAKAGSRILFSVTPASDDYELAEGWPKVLDENNASVTVSPALKDGEYQFTMPASDVTISAVFQEKAVTPAPHTITVTSTPQNGGTLEFVGKTLEGGKTTATVGEKVTFTVKPNPGYEMDGYPRMTGLSSTMTNHGDGSYTFTMEDEDVTISVAFKQVAYAIDVTQPANGTVSTEPAAMAAAGTTVTLSAEPDKGYELVGYTVTKDGGGAVTVTNGQFVMPNSAVTVSATFKLKQDQPDWSHWHKIDTWSNSVDGGISVGDDADMALAGSTVTFRVWHNYRYDYYDYDVYVLNDRTGARVSLDYDAYNDKYSFTMPYDDVTIYVYFDYAGRYSITKDVEGDGSIYVRSSADHGDTVWIEAAPNAGQSLTSLRVFYGEPWAYGDKGYYGYWDEADVHYSEYWDAYYFTMPADDVVVYARFTDGATVDVIAGDHGDAKVSSRYAEKGDWVYITAYPDEGYEVDSVTVTDSLGRSVKVTELSYDYFLFTMPGTSVDVKVTFRAKDYDVFYDVSRGDWYYKAVRFVHEKGIMEGTGTHYFSPEADLSRGMLATILYRLEGSPSVSGYSGFSDVADTAYYAKAVAWAKANGIVNGVTATAYEPDTAVTREELAAILCRYAAFKGKDTAISYDYLAGFSDANTSHVYARPALNWAVAYDIINGQGNGVLAPRATATRAEVAQVLMNYLEVFD